MSQASTVVDMGECGDRGPWPLPTGENTPKQARGDKSGHSEEVRRFPRWGSVNYERLNRVVAGVGELRLGTRGGSPSPWGSTKRSSGRISTVMDSDTARSPFTTSLCFQNGHQRQTTPVPAGRHQVRRRDPSMPVVSAQKGALQSRATLFAVRPIQCHMCLRRQKTEARSARGGCR